MRLSVANAKLLSALYYIMNARITMPARISNLTNTLLFTRNKLTLFRKYSTFPVGISEDKSHSVTKVKEYDKDYLLLPPPKLRLCPLCAPKLNATSSCSTTHLKKVYHNNHHERGKIDSLEGL